MKKVIIPIIIILIIGGLTSLLFFKEKSDLKKVKVADTTLTSRTFMN